MKVISWKSLLSSVLVGGICIIYTVINFDGFTDLLWIALFGYWMVKGIEVSISKDAYDENIKKVYRSKILYRDLFGKFAYIAPDIPFLIIMSAGLLVAIFPTTTCLKIVVLFLLVLTLMYVIWFYWYVSKNERLRNESDEWNTKPLSAEDKKAWERSERWHNICLGAVAVLAVPYFIFGDPRVYINNNKLENSLTALGKENVTLEEVVPFDWTTVYTFDPYTSIERIERVTGSKSPTLKESVNEGMTHFVFMDSGRVVSSVCAYPSSIGYSLSFTGGENSYYGYPDGGYSHIEYGDQITFDVMRDGEIIKLYAYVEE